MAQTVVWPKAWLRRGESLEVAPDRLVLAPFLRFGCSGRAEVATLAFVRSLGWSKVLAFYGLMGTVGFVGIGWEGAWERLGPGTRVWDWLEHLLVGLGVGLALVVITRWADRRFQWASRLTEEFRGILGDVTRREALVLACLSGVGEEVLFRGLLLPSLGLWISSVLFGLLHVGPNVRFLPWTVMATGVGLLFGSLFVWTGDVVAPAVAHTVVNFLNFRFLASPESIDTISLEPMVGEEHNAVRSYSQP